MLHQIGESTERNSACNKEPALIQLSDPVMLDCITVTH